MRRSHLKLLLAAGCGVLALAGAAGPALAQARTHHYAIQPQGLGAALRAFALSSGRDVVFDPALVEGKAARGVAGDLTDEDALRRLLDGSGLSFARTGSGGFVVRAAATAAAEAPPTVDEVIVTASKRAERAHDVPASLTAVSGQALAAEGAVRLEDYVAKIPGLVLSNVSFANGSNQVAIRGVTTGLGGNPTVGIYIDDSPFGASNSFGSLAIPDLDPQDLARVEVLRGPQGTLYGAGSLGGLLKYVTAAPDYDRAFGRVEADGWQVDGGGSGYGLRAAANLPLAANLALRVSGYDREDPGFIDDAAGGGRNLNNGRFDGGRAALAWRVNDDWTLKLSALLQHQYSKAAAVVDYDPFTMKPLYGDLDQVRSPGTGPMEQQIGAYALEVQGDLGFATLTSSSSYNKQTQHFNLEATPLFAPLIDAFFGVPGAGGAVLTDAGLDKFSQEIRLASPAANRLSWQVGGFYTHEHAVSRQTVNTFDAATGAPLVPPLPPFLDSLISTSFEELAVFGDATFRFNPRFDVTAGVRYSHNDQSQVQSASGLLEGDPTTLAGTSGDSAVTYLLTPRFHVNDDTMVYARLASGYRPGGPNLAVAGVPPTYGPDELVNYEVGIKSDLFDRKVSVDLAVYYIDWKNIQLNEVSPLGLSYFGNAGAATSRGAEASVSWRPIAGLEIDGDVSHTIAKLAAELPPGGGGVGVSGDPLPLTPRWSGQLSADYAFPLSGQWSGIAGASYRHVGASQGNFAAPGTPRFQLDAYDVVDLRAGVRNDRWSLTLYAKNIGDSRGQSADDNYIAVTRISIIQPRTFGVAVAASF
jgi:outer membrane receptor protein involved in Fe transport